MEWFDKVEGGRGISTCGWMSPSNYGYEKVGKNVAK